MIRIQCPGCKAAGNIDDSKAGATVACPKCKVKFQVMFTGRPIDIF